MGDRVSSRHTAESFIRPANSFDLLRILAATLVIVGHAWPLSGTRDAPELGGNTIHHLGVYMFFAISGYLLTQSWQRQPLLRPFVTRRSFRIFPALIVTVLTTAFIIGPSVSTERPSSYFADPSTWQYLSGLLLMPSYTLPGVFTEHPTQAVNGSLWSLGPEFLCYLMLAFTGLLIPKIRFAIRLALLLGLLSYLVVTPEVNHLTITLSAFCYFICASFLAQTRTLRPFSPWIAAPALVTLGLLGLFNEEIARLTALIVIPYAVVSFGNLPSRLATTSGKLGDPSYGMYLWAFLIQQLLIGVTEWEHPLHYALLSWVLALGAGYLSWHLIEARALNIGQSLSRRLARNIAIHRAARTEA